MQGEKEKSVFEAGTEYNASKEPVIQPPATVLQRNRSRLNVALETPAVTKGSFFLGLRDPPTSAGVRGWSSALETPLSTTTSLKTPGAIMRDLRKQQESAATFQTHSEMDQEDVEANDSWLFQDAPFQNCNLEMSPKGRDARLPSVMLPDAIHV